jgi:hypothetical protein
VFVFEVSFKIGDFALGNGLFRRLTRKTGVRGGVGSATGNVSGCGAMRSSAALMLNSSGRAIVFRNRLSLVVGE